MTTIENPAEFPFSDLLGLELDPTYAQLREQQPVIRVSCPYGHDSWLATKHEDVRTVMGDPRFSRAAAVERDEPRLTPLPMHFSVMGQDPPEHTRLRSLVANAFTTRRVEKMRPWVTKLTQRLLDEMAAKEAPLDLVEHFASPLTGRVICSLLGIPFEDRARFRVWMEAFYSTSGMTVQNVQASIDAMDGYITELVRLRRREPGDDLVSSMIQANDSEHSCTEEELVGLVTILLIAGHDTTAMQLATSVYVLLTQPEHASTLREHPELAERAAEELLRYVPLITHVTFARYATEDLELSGTLIKAGEAVLPAVPSANRDGEVFTGPDELDLSRERNPHLALGFGAHRCLGAALVRMELQVTLPALLTRFPRLRLAVAPDQVEWVTGMQARTLKHLPVSW